MTIYFDDDQRRHRDVPARLAGDRRDHRPTVYSPESALGKAILGAGAGQTVHLHRAQRRGHQGHGRQVRARSAAEPRRRPGWADAPVRAPAWHPASAGEATGSRGPQRADQRVGVLGAAGLHRQRRPRPRRAAAAGRAAGAPRRRRWPAARRSASSSAASCPGRSRAAHGEAAGSGRPRPGRARSPAAAAAGRCCRRRAPPPPASRPATAPASSAATPTAPAGSTTSLPRSSSISSAREMSSSVTVTTSSTSLLTWAKVRSPGPADRDAVGDRARSAGSRTGCAGRAARAGTAAAPAACTPIDPDVRVAAPWPRPRCPEISPPPPTPVTIVRTSGHCSRISSADRALPGDHVRVVERVDQHRAGALGELLRRDQRLVDACCRRARPARRTPWSRRPSAAARRPA